MQDTPRAGRVVEFVLDMEGRRSNGWNIPASESRSVGRRSDRGVVCIHNGHVRPCSVLVGCYAGADEMVSRSSEGV